MLGDQSSARSKGRRLHQCGRFEKKWVRLRRALVGLLLLTSPRSFAQAAAPLSGPICSEPAPIPVAFTLSGGVSLGAHQAGFLYYTSLVFRANPQMFQTKLITGSSAGGLNTMLSILALCGDSKSPSQSALWRGWVGIRASDLVDHEEADSRALLSRKGFTRGISQVREEWNRGLPTSCDLVVGITATRLNPRRASDATDLGFSRQEEKFTLRIRGRGPGQPPLITNYVNALNGGKQPVLDLKPGEDAQNFEAFSDLLFATAAFPLALPQQKINYCLADHSFEHWKHANYPLTCLGAQVETAEFLDGGMLDNKPLGFTERLTRAGLDTPVCAPARWREIPVPLVAAPLQNRAVLHLLSDTGAQLDRGRGGESGYDGVLDVLGSFFTGFVDSSRSRDSLVALEQDPRLATQVALARNRYPRMGEPLLGFFGLFETDFRVFDFYLGMYEARAFFRDEVAKSLRRGSQTVAGSLRLPDGGARGDWAALHCLDDIFSRAGQGSESCRLLRNSNFETLARLSVARWQRLCGETDPMDPKTKCTPPVEGDHRSSEAEELDFIFEYLAENEFEFQDLGLTRAQAAEAAGRMKSESLKAIFRLSSEQPVGEGLVSRTALPAVLNSIANLPTERYAFVTTGPATRFGISVMQPSHAYPPSLRLMLGGQIENMAAWFAQDSGRSILSPWAGIEWEPRSWSSAFVQTRLELIGGYRFNPEASGGGGGSANSCEAGRSSPLDCRGVLIQAGVTSTFLERVRLELAFEGMPFIRSGDVPIQLLPGIGLQFYY